MSTVETKKITPEDLLKMPDGDQFELVDGQLLQSPMSFWSSYVAGNVDFFIRSFCRKSGGFWVLPEGTTYRCFPFDSSRVRKPDVSVLRVERYPLGNARMEGHVKTCPDLAVEVVSPTNLAEALEEKIQDYLEAGVPLVWVIHPEKKTIYVYHGGSVRILHENDDITGEDVLIGFRCRVGEFFEPPSQAK